MRIHQLVVPSAIKIIVFSKDLAPPVAHGAVVLAIVPEHPTVGIFQHKPGPPRGGVSQKHQDRRVRKASAVTAIPGIPCSPPAQGRFIEGIAAPVGAAVIYRVPVPTSLLVRGANENL